MHQENTSCCTLGVPIAEEGTKIIRGLISLLYKKKIKSGVLVEILEDEKCKCKNYHVILIYGKKYSFCDNQAVAARIVAQNDGYAISTKLLELQEEIKQYYKEYFEIDIEKIAKEDSEKCCDIQYITADDEDELVRHIFLQAKIKGIILKLPRKGNLCRIKKRYRECDDCFVVKKDSDEYCDNPITRIKHKIRTKSKKISKK